jgi:hypothetical protein
MLLALLFELKLFERIQEKPLEIKERIAKNEYGECPFGTILISMLLEQEKVLDELRSKIEAKKDIG